MTRQAPGRGRFGTRRARCRGRGQGQCRRRRRARPPQPAARPILRVGRRAAQATLAERSSAGGLEIAREQRLLPVVEGGIPVSRAVAAGQPRARGDPGAQQAPDRGILVDPNGPRPVGRHRDIAPRHLSDLCDDGRPASLSLIEGLEHQEGGALAEDRAIVIIARRAGNPRHPGRPLERAPRARTGGDRGSRSPRRRPRPGRHPRPRSPRVPPLALPRDLRRRWAG